MRTKDQRKVDELYETVRVLFDELGVKLEQLRIHAAAFGMPMVSREEREKNLTTWIPNPTEILKIVCDTLTQRVDDVISKARYAELVTARTIAAKLIRDHWAVITLQEIGNVLGGRDHATVIHMQRDGENRINTDEDFRKKFDRCEFELSNKILINKNKDNV